MLVGILALGAAASTGAQGRVLVVPLGDGDSFIPSVDVAQSIAKRYSVVRREKGELFFPLPALPPAKADLDRRAGRARRQAWRAYRNMAYSTVINKADEALRLYKQLLKSGEGKAGYLECLHLIAAAHLFEGNGEDAQKVMNDAVVFAETPPDAAGFNPRVQELYQTAIGESREVGRVVFDIKPDALVWFNDTEYCRGHGSATIRAGLYLVRVFRPGYALYQRWFRVPTDQQRELSVALTKAPNTSPPLISTLRAEQAEAAPSVTVNQLALDHQAERVLLVAPGSACDANRCALTLRGARDGKWYFTRNVTVAGNAREIAAALLPRAGETALRVDPPNPPTGGSAHAAAVRAAARDPFASTQCSFNHQCGINETCEAGRCIRPTPVVKKWWFWTIVGGAAAALTVAIVVPATRPQTPVVELR